MLAEIQWGATRACSVCHFARVFGNARSPSLWLEADCQHGQQTEEPPVRNGAVPLHSQELLHHPRPRLCPQT